MRQAGSKKIQIQRQTQTNTKTNTNQNTKTNSKTNTRTTDDRPMKLYVFGKDMTIGI